MRNMVGICAMCKVYARGTTHFRVALAISMLRNVLRIFLYHSMTCSSESPETSRARFRLGVGGGEHEYSESLDTVRRSCERPPGESEAFCGWVARASGGTEGLRRGEAATVAGVVCVTDVVGAGVLAAGADAFTVRGTGFS